MSQVLCKALGILMVLGPALVLEDSWANAVVASLRAVVANPLKVSFTENLPPSQAPAGTLGGWGELPAALSHSVQRPIHLPPNQEP